jgi:hypothetical protein
MFHRPFIVFANGFVRTRTNQISPSRILHETCIPYTTVNKISHLLLRSRRNCLLACINGQLLIVSVSDHRTSQFNFNIPDVSIPYCLKCGELRSFTHISHCKECARSHISVCDPCLEILSDSSD